LEAFTGESATVLISEDRRVVGPVAYMAMLAMALGRIKENQSELMRSLVKAAG
jgi:hypothetical protein